MSKTIFLDPGHGGRDPGAVNGSRHESHDNLRMALAVKPLLQRHGFNILMSRAEDVFVSLQERTNMANAANADLLISLHRNAFHDPSAHGTEIIVSMAPTTAELALACSMLENLAAAGIQRNRGVKRMNMHMLRESRMTSVMPELGFITNTRDNELFDMHFDAYAAAIVKSVCEYFGVAFNDGNNAAPVQSDELYRVQVGAFRVRENAERLMQLIIDAGFDAFLVVPDRSRED